MKTRFTCEFIGVGEVYQLREIILDSLRAAGYEVELILDVDNTTTYVYEIIKTII